MVHRIFL